MSDSPHVLNALEAVQTRLGEPWRTAKTTGIVYRSQGSVMIALGVHSTRTKPPELFMDAAIFFEELAEVRPWRTPLQTFEAHWRWFFVSLVPDLSSNVPASEVEMLAEAANTVAARLASIVSLQSLFADPDLSRFQYLRSKLAPDRPDSYELHFLAAIASKDVARIEQAIRDWTNDRRERALELASRRDADSEPDHRMWVEAALWERHRSSLMPLGVDEAWCLEAAGV